MTKRQRLLRKAGLSDAGAMLARDRGGEVYKLWKSADERTRRLAVLAMAMDLVAETAGVDMIVMQDDAEAAEAQEILCVVAIARGEHAPKLLAEAQRLESEADR